MVENKIKDIEDYLNPIVIKKEKDDRYSFG